MPTSDVTNVFVYSGDLASLYSGDPVSPGLVGSPSLTGQFDDNDGFLSTSDDGVTTFTPDGGSAAAVTFLGSGTIRTLGAGGTTVEEQTVMFFSSGGVIYGYVPGGLPGPGGSDFGLSVDPAAEFVLPLTTGQIVDGTTGGDLIDRSFIDSDGDRITSGPDTVFGYAGDDTIIGSAGDDMLFGGTGDDLLFGGEGNDSLWGEEGNDTLWGGAGDDKLVGGAGDDLLIAGEGNDILFGDETNGDLGGRLPTDAPEPGFGNDTLVSSTGNDTMFGGSGDDVFVINDGFGSHLIIGGETGETVGDRIDGSAVTEDMTVVYTADEAGTIARPGGPTPINFVEIERVDLGSGDDRVTVTTSTTGTVDGADGFDTLVLPDPPPGSPRPVVTITRTQDNGDGTTTRDGFVDFPDGSRLTFTNFEEIICFAPGTGIDTDRGRIAVEALRPGDRVLTRDHGYQPLVWCARRDLPADALAANPALAPVRIAAGALGNGLPERDLVVSPRHRMLVSGPRAALMFGAREVLVAAADLVGLPGITRDPQGTEAYVHVMCARHEILRAEGSWSESFHPAAEVLGALDMATRAELLALFPELGRPGTVVPAARPTLTPAQARALRAA